MTTMTTTMTGSAEAWWRQPLRVIQPNLQVRDTERIDPERLAAQLEDLGANTVVFNVGGIYGWYPTAVPYHHVNEFLPASRDLLRDTIEACHKRGLRFIARFDFSKAADWIYQSRPEWFARAADGEPLIIGAKRPGSWSLLLSTCINGGYRNEEVAEPVLREALAGYDIDGVFFNAPGYTVCFCDGCKRKYEAVYGKPLPDEAALFEPDWKSRCMRDSMERLHRLIKAHDADMPMILYYDLYRDNLYDRVKTTDMLCTEPQDVLSLGHRGIPEFWKPALSIKLGRSIEERPAPFGIVHSSPGMDWRHTGLPPAEYAFWLAQIPAHGGSIWHSLTGVPDTIGDKRILRTVKEHNERTRKAEGLMHGAKPRSQVALIWSANPAAEGWADALINLQTPFDVLLDEQATAEALGRYKALIVPEGFAATASFAARIAAYAESGGYVVAEGSWPLHQWGLAALFGVRPETYTGENLIASYLRFEGGALQAGLEETELIAHRGRVIYCRPDGAETLATLVPPFSPLESVGAPPERASHAVARTDIPLALRSRRGSGGVYYFPFSLSGLVNDYRLGEHYRLIGNTLDAILGADKLIAVTPAPGLQVTVFERPDGLLVHLVNGAGRRPLTAPLPLRDIALAVRTERAVAGVTALIGGGEPPFIEEDGVVRFSCAELEVWECLHIRYT